MPIFGNSDGEERLTQGEERRLEAEERAVAPKRKYVKKSAKWHTKPIQAKEPVAKKLDWRDCPIEPNKIQESRRYKAWADEYHRNNKNRTVKRYKSGWQKAVFAPSKPDHYTHVSYFKVERTEFDPDKFFKELEEQELLKDNPSVETKARA